MTQRLPKPEDTILAGLSQLVQDCLKRIDNLERKVMVLEKCQLNASEALAGDLGDLNLTRHGPRDLAILGGDPSL